MRRLLLAIAAALVLGACAPDDQVFDVSALSERHQRIFAEAAADLNERYPERAQFEIGDGISAALYGDTCHEFRGDCGRDGYTAPPFQHAGRARGWRITFRYEWVADVSDDALLVLTAHELCHVLGFGHNEGNPQGGSC